MAGSDQKMASAIPGELPIQNAAQSVGMAADDPTAHNAPPPNPSVAAKYVGQQNNVDQMLYSHPQLLRNVTWSTDQAPGTVIAEFKVDPRSSTNIIRYFAAAYNCWSGSLELAAKICGTGFHAGALMIVKVPPNVDYKNADLQQLSLFPNVIMDPKTPQFSGLEMYDQKNVEYHYFTDEQEKQKIGGTVIAIVYATLTLASAGSSSIAVVFSQCLGKNFRFHQLIDPTLKVNPPASVTVDVPDWTKPSGVNVGAYDSDWAEGFTALRIAKMHVVNTSTYTASGKLACSPVGSRPIHHFAMSNAVGWNTLAVAGLLHGYYNKYEGVDDFYDCNGNIDPHGEFAFSGVAMVKSASEDTSGFEVTYTSVTSTLYRFTIGNSSKKLIDLALVSTETGRVFAAPVLWQRNWSMAAYRGGANDTGPDIVLKNNEKIIVFGSASGSDATRGFVSTAKLAQMCRQKELRKGTDHQFKLRTVSPDTPLFAIRLSEGGYFSVHEDIKPTSLLLKDVYLQYVGPMSKFDTLPKPRVEVTENLARYNRDMVVEETLNNYFEHLSKRVEEVHLPLHDRIKELEQKAKSIPEEPNIELNVVDDEEVPPLHCVGDMVVDARARLQLHGKGLVPAGLPFGDYHVVTNIGFEPFSKVADGYFTTNISGSMEIMSADSEASTR